jgi:anti-sigma28 factor (negative regulator of flagellin synthesis)
VQSDVDEGSTATGRIRSFESATRFDSAMRFQSDGVTMLTVDDPARPARVARVRDAVAAGHYRPPAEAVAERLLAFFGPSWQQ